MSRKNRNVMRAVALVVTGLLAVTGARGETVEGMLEEKVLIGAFNPILLDYLIEEGRQAVADEQRVRALDQLVTGLRADIEITPEEQRAAAAAAAAAGLAQLFGGSDGRDLGDVAQDATYLVWKGWVDSAFTLQRAGYGQDAEAFFSKCIEIYPYSDLRGRCAIGLAIGKPAEAFDRLMALTDGNDMEAIKVALRLVGELAGAEGFPAELRSRAVARITEFTGGIKKASYGEAACQGLIAAGDPAAVPTLKKMGSGMMNTALFPCARRGLLLTFGDRSVVPAMEKQLKGGAFSATKPAEKLGIAALLMEAGEPAGFAFAESELTRKKKKGFAKMMASSSDDVDLRPSLVRALVRVGGSEAIRVLSSGFAAAEPGTWLQTWIAVGLLELGDTSQSALARQSLTDPEWAFTTVRIATALAATGDYSGVPALEALYAQASRGVEPDLGEATLAFLVGEGGAYEAGREAKNRRLIRLRREIAAGLATMDRAECVPLLEAMLEDTEPAVRIAAAYGVASMSAPEAGAARAKALAVDYGTVGERQQSPVVHAHLLRSAGRHADGDDGVALGTVAMKSSYPAVRFLALCMWPPQG